MPLIHLARLAFVSIATTALFAAASAESPSDRRDGLGLEPPVREVAPSRARTFLLSERLPFAMCFAPGTPQAEAMAVHEAAIKLWLASQGEGGVAFNLTTQWSFASGPNSPITLRWSVAPDGLSIPNNAGVGSSGDPVETYRAFYDRVLSVQIRDGLRDVDGQGVEVPLGQGEVVWDELLAMLEEGSFRGWLVATRSSGDDKVGDMARAIKYIRAVAPGE